MSLGQILRAALKKGGGAFKASPSKALPEETAETPVSLPDRLKEAEAQRQAQQDKLDEPVYCDYCQKEAEIQWGSQVYPHREDLEDLKFYVCEPCDARVGCHKETGLCYGRLAKAELRGLKMEAHKEFDRLWRGPASPLTRTQAYMWLSSTMGLDPDLTHMGMFDEEQCCTVAELSAEFYNSWVDCDDDSEKFLLFAQHNLWFDTNGKAFLISEMDFVHLDNAVKMLQSGRAKNRKRTQNILASQRAKLRRIRDAEAK